MAPDRLDQILRKIAASPLPGAPDDLEARVLKAVHAGVARLEAPAGQDSVMDSLEVL